MRLILWFTFVFAEIAFSAQRSTNQDCKKTKILIFDTPKSKSFKTNDIKALFYVMQEENCRDGIFGEHSSDVVCSALANDFPSAISFADSDIEQLKFVLNQINATCSHIDLELILKQIPNCNASKKNICRHIEIETQKAIIVATDTTPIQESKAKAAFSMIKSKSIQDLSAWTGFKPSEASDAWRVKSPNAFLEIEGLFDHDNEIDIARLTKSDKDYLVLTVHLSEDDYKAEEIFKERWSTFSSEMGIKAVQNGRYKTACGKGHFECKKGEPSEINIQNQAIELFKYRGASSYFLIKEKSNAFDRYWIND